MNLGKPQATFRRGLAGIREARNLATHAMRGALFELHFRRDVAVAAQRLPGLPRAA